MRAPRSARTRWCCDQRLARMVRRARAGFGGRSLRRSLLALTRTAVRAGSRAMAGVLRAAPGRPDLARAKTSKPPRTTVKRSPVKSVPAKMARAAGPGPAGGMATGAAGTRLYRLYMPPGVSRSERLPLLVMLHGCAQDAQGLAASTHMNRVAARERFVVLYPEQGRLANAQACWNWYDTRAGRAQREADSIVAAIDKVCASQPVDPQRIALAGLSAGASMAALLATRHPERFDSISMHSGIGPGVAQSPAGAVMAMRGRKHAAAPMAGSAALPALLVIQGNSDVIVASSNGVNAAQRWAAHAGAQAGTPRRVQRGARYAATVTDYRAGGRLVASLCAINGLGHAWSGGTAGQPWSDPKGPDASRMVWAFAARQFALKVRGKVR